MKTILLKDVDHVGRTGDIKDVSPGYFRNFLLPRELAKIATPAALKEEVALEERRRKEDETRQVRLQALIGVLAKEKLVFEESATAEGQLYGSVSAADIAARLREKGFKDIGEEHIILATPLKTLGEHTVPLRLGDGMEGGLSVIIEKHD